MKDGSDPRNQFVGPDRLEPRPRSAEQRLKALVEQSPLGISVARDGIKLSTPTSPVRVSSATTTRRNSSAHHSLTVWLPRTARRWPNTSCAARKASRCHRPTRSGDFAGTDRHFRCTSRSTVLIGRTGRSLWPISVISPPGRKWRMLFGSQDRCHGHQSENPESSRHRYSPPQAQNFQMHERTLYLLRLLFLFIFITSLNYQGWKSSTKDV